MLYNTVKEVVMNKSSSSLFLITAILILFLTGCPAPNTDTPGNTSNYSCSHVLSGTITQTKTLEAGKTYLVDSAVYVKSGGKLVIENGTFLKFSSRGSLTVYSGGDLSARGATFTSIRDDATGSEKIKGAPQGAPAGGDWTFVKINGGHASLDNCTFSYGGYSGGGNAKYQNSVLIITESGTATISGCTFKGNGIDNVSNNVEKEKQETDGALYVEKPGSTMTIYGCTFEDNIWPLSVPFNLTMDEPIGTFINNKYNGIKVDHTTIEDGTTVKWIKQSVPYCLMESNDYTIYGTLQIIGGADGAPVKIECYKINKILIRSYAHLKLCDYTTISGYGNSSWGGIQFQSYEGSSVTKTCVLTSSDETVNPGGGHAIVITGVRESSKPNVPAKYDNSSV